MAKRKADPEAAGDVAGETLLPDIDVEGATDARLLETAVVTWSNAALRSTVVRRFASMGSHAMAAVDAALEPPAARNGFLESKTAIVTAVAVLEALADANAVERLMGLTQDGRHVAAAHARGALTRLGHEPPERPEPRGPKRKEIEAQIAKGKPKERELGLAFLVLHADLELLPAARAALNDSAAKVREEAARACARLGDADCLGPLLAWLQARPSEPKLARRGAPPAEVQDALTAWQALCELGDVRAFGEVRRFEAEVSYARLRSEHGTTNTENFFARHLASKFIL